MSGKEGLELPMVTPIRETVRIAKEEEDKGLITGSHSSVYQTKCYFTWLRSPIYSIICRNSLQLEIRGCDEERREMDK